MATTSLGTDWSGRPAVALMRDNRAHAQTDRGFNVHLGAMVFVKRKERLSSKGKQESPADWRCSEPHLTSCTTQSPQCGERWVWTEFLSQLRLGGAWSCLDATVALTIDVPAPKPWIRCLVTRLEGQVRSEELTGKMQFPYYCRSRKLRGGQIEPSQAHCPQVSLSPRARHIWFPALEVQAARLSSPISRGFPFLSAANRSRARLVSQPQSRPDGHFHTVSGRPPVSRPWLLLLSAQSSQGT